jgi:hypothetical protein
VSSGDQSLRACGPGASRAGPAGTDQGGRTFFAPATQAQYPCEPAVDAPIGPTGPLGPHGSRNPERPWLRLTCPVAPAGPPGAPTGPTRAPTVLAPWAACDSPVWLLVAPSRRTGGADRTRRGPTAKGVPPRPTAPGDARRGGTRLGVSLDAEARPEGPCLTGRNLPTLCTQLRPGRSDRHPPRALPAGGRPCAHQRGRRMPALAGAPVAPVLTRHCTGWAQVGPVRACRGALREPDHCSPSRGEYSMHSAAGGRSGWRTRVTLSMRANGNGANGDELVPLKSDRQSYLCFADVFCHDNFLGS